MVDTATLQQNIKNAQQKNLNIQPNPNFTGCGINFLPTDKFEFSNSILNNKTDELIDQLTKAGKPAHQIEDLKAKLKTVARNFHENMTQALAPPGDAVAEFTAVVSQFPDLNIAPAHFTQFVQAETDRLNNALLRAAADAQAKITDIAAHNYLNTNFDTRTHGKNIFSSALNRIRQNKTGIRFVKRPESDNHPDYQPKPGDIFDESADPSKAVAGAGLTAKRKWDTQTGYGIYDIQDENGNTIGVMRYKNDGSITSEFMKDVDARTVQFAKDVMKNLTDLMNSKQDNIFGWLVEFMALLFAGILGPLYGIAIKHMQNRDSDKAFDMQRTVEHLANARVGKRDAAPFNYNTKLSVKDNMDRMERDLALIEKLRNGKPPIHLKYELSPETIAHFQKAVKNKEITQDQLDKFLAKHNAAIKAHNDIVNTHFTDLDNSIAAQDLNTVPMLQDKIAKDKAFVKERLDDLTAAEAALAALPPGDAGIPSAQAQVQDAQTNLLKAQERLAKSEVHLAAKEQKAANDAFSAVIPAPTSGPIFDAKQAADAKVVAANANLAIVQNVIRDLDAAKTAVTAANTAVTAATTAVTNANNAVTAAAALPNADPNKINAVANANRQLDAANTQLANATQQQLNTNVQLADANLAHADWNVAVAQRALDEARNAVVGGGPTPLQQQAISKAQTRFNDATAARTIRLNDVINADNAILNAATAGVTAANNKLATLTAGPHTPIELAQALKDIEVAKVGVAQVEVTQAFRGRGIKVVNGVPDATALAAAGGPTAAEQEALDNLGFANRAVAIADAQLLAQTDLENANTAVTTAAGMPTGNPNEIKIRNLAIANANVQLVEAEAKIMSAERDAAQLAFDRVPPARRLGSPQETALAEAEARVLESNFNLMEARTNLASLKSTLDKATLDALGAKPGAGASFEDKLNYANVEVQAKESRVKLREAIENQAKANLDIKQNIVNRAAAGGGASASQRKALKKAQKAYDVAKDNVFIAQHNEAKAKKDRQETVLAQAQAKATPVVLATLPAIQVAQAKATLKKATIDSKQTNVDLKAVQVARRTNLLVEAQDAKPVNQENIDEALIRKQIAQANLDLANTELTLAQGGADVAAIAAHADRASAANKVNAAEDILNDFSDAKDDIVRAMNVLAEALSTPEEKDNASASKFVAESSFELIRAKLEVEEARRDNTAGGGARRAAAGTQLTNAQTKFNNAASQQSVIRTAHTDLTPKIDAVVTAQNALTAASGQPYEVIKEADLHAARMDMDLHRANLAVAMANLALASNTNPALQAGLETARNTAIANQNTAQTNLNAARNQQTDILGAYNDVVSKQVALNTALDAANAAPHDVALQTRVNIAQMDLKISLAKLAVEEAKTRELANPSPASANATRDARANLSKLTACETLNMSINNGVDSIYSSLANSSEFKGEDFSQLNLLRGDTVEQYLEKLINFYDEAISNNKVTDNTRDSLNQFRTQLQTAIDQAGANVDPVIRDKFDAAKTAHENAENNLAPRI